MVDSSFTIETECIADIRSLKDRRKNSVTNVNSLTQLYAILRINSIICYQSSR